MGNKVWWRPVSQFSAGSWPLLFKRDNKVCLLLASFSRKFALTGDLTGCSVPSDSEVESDAKITQVGTTTLRTPTKKLGVDEEL